MFVAVGKIISYPLECMAIWTIWNIAGRS